MSANPDSNGMCENPEAASLSLARPITRTQIALTFFVGMLKYGVQYISILEAKVIGLAAIAKEIAMDEIRDTVIKLEREHVDRADEIAANEDYLKSFLDIMGAEAPALKWAFDWWSDKTSDEFPPDMRLAGASSFDMIATYLIAGLSSAYGGFPHIPQEWVEPRFMNICLDPSDRGIGSEIYDTLHAELHRINDDWATTFCRASRQLGLKSYGNGGGHIRILLLASIFINAVEKEERQRQIDAREEVLDEQRVKMPVVVEFIESLDF